MIIKFGILIALILGALLFVGVKMGEDINVKEVKMFFFILYGMSIFTVFNIVISVYFFTSLRNKRGPPGPKGKPGRLGDRGDDGKCVEDNCLKKSLETIIVETLEKKLAEEYDKDPSNKEFYKPLQAFEKILICSYVNQLYQKNPDKFRNFFANDIYKTTDAQSNPSLVGTLKPNNDANNPIQGTSVFKIQELKKKISLFITDFNINSRNKNLSSHFLYKTDQTGPLNNTLSTKITGVNTDYQLDSENCT